MTVVVVEAEALEVVAAALERGDPVVIPTDTVYGLAARADRPDAVDRLFALKLRPATVAVAVLVADTGQAAEIGQFDERASQLVERLWPGPLTVVVDRRPGVDLALGGDEKTVGIRCPLNDFVRLIARRVGPLATTSANRHGEPTEPTLAAVLAQLGPDVAVGVDGGFLGGQPSTVVDLTRQPPEVLRVGPVSVEDLGLDN